MKKLNAAKRRNFSIYPILDWYILREFLIPFFLLIFAFTILFFIGDVFDDIKDFIETESSIFVMIRFFLLKLPGNIRFILPISVMLSCMYTMANFGKNSEVTAMRSCGVSLFRCGGAIYFAALIVTLINFWFNESVVPGASREAYIIRKSAKYKNYESLLYNRLVYRSPDKHRTWFFQSFNPDKKNYDVILKQYRDDGTLQWELEAGSIEYIEPEEKKYTIINTPLISLPVAEEGWVFKDSKLTVYNPDGLHENPEIIPFVSFTDLPDKPIDIVNAIKAPEDLPSWIILDKVARTKNMPEAIKAKYMTIFYYRIAFPWASMIAVLLGVPLAAHNERRGVMLSIMTAVLVIIVYQFSSHVFKMLGEGNIIHPLIAGIGPTVAFFIFGWYKIIKSR